MTESFPYDQLAISTVPDLTDQVERTTELIGRGAYGSVYKAWLAATVNAKPAAVAIKIIEFVPPRDDAQRKKRFKKIKREVSLWCSIKHENILPLLGTARINGDANVPAFVCPWMENGNAKEFCSRNPRFPPILILYDIINGLHYLHTFQPEIVHGDIKAVNVLINNRCEACLCDFGLSRSLIDNTLWKTSATHAGGTVRWMAPELLSGDASTPTKESDIYAYAMTCYEILSGDIPFKSVSNDMVIPVKVMKGQRPDRMEPSHSDFMWDIMTRCWEQEPEDRLPTEKVSEFLRPKVCWKEVEQALAKIGEKDAALAKVEKEMVVLKEQMALKEEKQKALEDAISEKERNLNSLNASLQWSMERLEKRVEWLEREKDDAEEKYERQVEEAQALKKQFEETMHQTEAAELHQEFEHSLLTEELMSLRHTNWSLREEVERLKHDAQEREEEAVAVHQKQRNEITRLYEEVARFLEEADTTSGNSGKAGVRHKYNPQKDPLDKAEERSKQRKKEIRRARNSLENYEPQLSYGLAPQFQNPSSEIVETGTPQSVPPRTHRLSRSFSSTPYYLTDNGSNGQESLHPRSSFTPVTFSTTPSPTMMRQFGHAPKRSSESCTNIPRSESPSSDHLSHESLAGTPILWALDDTSCFDDDTCSTISSIYFASDPDEKPPNKGKGREITVASITTVTDSPVTRLDRDSLVHSERETLEISFPLVPQFQDSSSPQIQNEWETQKSHEVSLPPVSLFPISRFWNWSSQKVSKRETESITSGTNCSQKVSGQETEQPHHVRNSRS